MTIEQKVEMFRMRLEGYSYVEIGKQFGCSRQRVYQIIGSACENKYHCIYPNLRKWMIDNNCSHSRFAEELGINYNQWYLRATGKVPLRINEIRKVLEITGMSFEVCFAEEED